LLLFGAEYLAFQFAIKKFRNLDIQNYILSVVSYGCGTWSLTLKEQRKLRMF